MGVVKIYLSLSLLLLLHFHIALLVYLMARVACIHTNIYNNLASRCVFIEFESIEANEYELILHTCNNLIFSLHLSHIQMPTFSLFLLPSCNITNLFIIHCNYVMKHPRMNDIFPHEIRIKSKLCFRIDNAHPKLTKQVMQFNRLSKHLRS